MLPLPLIPGGGPGGGIPGGPGIGIPGGGIPRPIIGGIPGGGRRPNDEYDNNNNNIVQLEILAFEILS